ncbi:hypothetical protein [Alkalilacustris brevis]|uniref:hypothetical protein n=1 Tax=Alkalilacustris brevis TaxID=2026338 RepID=UPI000E0DAF68|nr:hypothetical protein [Alkalilacustris brevis]
MRLTLLTRICGALTAALLLALTLPAVSGEPSAQARQAEAETPHGKSVLPETLPAAVLPPAMALPAEAQDNAETGETALADVAGAILVRGALPPGHGGRRGATGTKPLLPGARGPPGVTT